MIPGEYDKNSDSGENPETAGKGNGLIFVVHRHDASHLHFDFRLESGGVLKSWAVPKGPSMNPRDKRLAIMVEDHPLAYADFEGAIPEGRYGAGTVEIWDSGRWEPAEHFRDTGKAIKNGEIKFYLHGKKLKGEFVLLRMEHSNTKNGWLLIKKDDAYATDKPYNAADR